MLKIPPPPEFCITPRMVGCVPVAPRRRRLTLFGIRPAPVTIAVTVTAVGVLRTMNAGLVVSMPTAGVTAEVRGRVARDGYCF
jgi:hypothetical protein